MHGEAGREAAALNLGTTRDVRNRQDAFRPHLNEQGIKMVADAFGKYRRSGEDRLVAYVRLAVLLTEVTDIDHSLPTKDPKAAPGRL